LLPAGLFYTMDKTRKKKKNKPRVLLRISSKKLISLIFIVGVLYFILFSGSHSLVQYLRQSSRKQALIENIDSLKTQKKRLEQESERLKNDLFYIEKIAREKYNMKKKDEKVYQVIKEK
jgi:cell division protein FtsB